MTTSPARENGERARTEMVEGMAEDAMGESVLHLAIRLMAVVADSNCIDTAQITRVARRHEEEICTGGWRCRW